MHQYTLDELEARANGPLSCWNKPGWQRALREAVKMLRNPEPCQGQHVPRDRLDRLAAACLPVVYEDHEPPERNAHWAIALALALRNAVDAALPKDNVQNG